VISSQFFHPQKYKYKGIEMQENQVQEKNELAYSCEGDDSCVCDLQELIDTHELNIGDTYTQHDLVRNSASYYFSIDDLLEQMSGSANEDAGEHAEGFPDLSDNEKSELNAIISNWLDQRVSVNFFAVINPKECTVTAEYL
jgi:hypothetical protein